MCWVVVLVLFQPSNLAYGQINNEVKIIPSMASWGMDSSTIDKMATHTTLNNLIKLRNLGSSEDIMEDNVHDKIKEMAAYSFNQGISLIADLDLRLALPTFESRYPDELQQMLVTKEYEVNQADTMNFTLNNRIVRDHYHNKPPYEFRFGSFVRAYAYQLTPEGLIDPTRLEDISSKVQTTYPTNGRIDLAVPMVGIKSFTHILVMVSFTYQYPDLFSSYFVDFHQELIKKYGDVSLGGGFMDEWGFPAALKEESIESEFWYSTNRANVYADITGGRELLSDFLLMYRGIDGKQSERFKAINHFRYMVYLRMKELEENFYATIKQVFGSEAIVAVHPTWFPYPEKREFKKNGLDWWVARRDYAQTDEVVPYGVRTAIAKKWKSPVWYNMYYRFGIPKDHINADDYIEELWCSALAGGRLNSLPSIVGSEGLLGSEYIRAESRIRLLNYIDPSPLNCPVAVIFGHSAAMNWAWTGYDDVGMSLVDSLWKQGIATDLIPSSEILNGSLVVDDNGYIRYGDQRYEAAVLYHPQFEESDLASFFENASKGNTQLYRIGEWTVDFDGKQIDDDISAALPKETNSSFALKDISFQLDKKQVERQVPATRKMEGFGHMSYTTPATGFSYLLDGTLLQIAGANTGSGDTIRSTMKVNGFDVTFDAVGVAAVRLDDQGNVQAIAAGGLRLFETGKMNIQLEERVDLVVRLNDQGYLVGFIQGWKGDLPPVLLSITSQWTRLDLPVPYKQRKKKVLFEARVEEGLIGYNQMPLIMEKVTDIDGNVYPLVNIGEQTWMAQNLRTTKLNDGTPIELENDAKNQLIKKGYEWSRENENQFDYTYGRHYNWNSVQTGNLCPKDWRVPTTGDLVQLITYLTGEEKDTAANKNDTKFGPLAGGYVSPYGGLFGMGDYGYWWSSEERSVRLVWKKDSQSLYATNGREISGGYGLSIRCIKE